MLLCCLQKSYKGEHKFCRYLDPTLCSYFLQLKQLPPGGDLLRPKESTKLLRVRKFLKLQGFTKPLSKVIEVVMMDWGEEANLLVFCPESFMDADFMSPCPWWIRVGFSGVRIALRGSVPPSSSPPTLLLVTPMKLTGSSSWTLIELLL